jgi:hypothetical protein
MASEQDAECLAIKSIHMDLEAELLDEVTRLAWEEARPTNR